MPFVCVSGVFAGTSIIRIPSEPQSSTDSLNFRVFDTSEDFSIFIAEDLAMSAPLLDSSIIGQSKKDSLHFVLNRDKQIIIPKTSLNEFLDFTIQEPVTAKVMDQTVNLITKDKLAKYTFEVKEGDHFFLKFDISKGGGIGMQVEVLLNDVRVTDEMSLSRKKEFALDFVVAQVGKVDVVFRNFGFFRLQGKIQVDITPKKEKIRFQERKLVRVYEKEKNMIVRDTLFKTLIDEPVMVSHSLNLTGNSTFQRQLEILEDRKILGFAIFMYPYEQKEKLEFQRREVYREDPLQDFAWKELIGKSYTYLPEFFLSDLDLSIFDFNYKNHWLNGQNKVGNNWKLSANSKRNYAFWGINEELKDNKITIKLTNKSALYNHELGLQVIVLFEEIFTVIKPVETKEFDEIIILSLL
jgi:hypothetical protein